MIKMNPYLDDYEIFDNRVVNIGVTRPWPMAAENEHYSLSGYQQKLLGKFKTKGFLVAQNGKLCWEYYAKDHNISSLSNSFAISNSIVSLLIGVALDAGLIRSLDDRASLYIPHLTHRRRITIRHLLTMSSGLKWNESFYLPGSSFSKAYYSTDLEKLIFGLRSEEKPGITFNYCSGNIQLLAMILKNVTGMNLSEYASLKLWQPLGAEYIVQWSLDQENGIEKAFGCFHATMRDFARIGQLVLQKGKWEGCQLVSEAYLQEALEPANYLQTNNGIPVGFYGFHFWLTETHGHKVMYMKGLKGQYVIMIPSINAVVVRIGERGQAFHNNKIPEDMLIYLEVAFQLLKEQAYDSPVKC